MLNWLLNLYLSICLQNSVLRLFGFGRKHSYVSKQLTLCSGALRPLFGCVMQIYCPTKHFLCKTNSTNVKNTFLQVPSFP